MSVFQTSNSAPTRSDDGAALDFATRNIATGVGMGILAGTAFTGAAILTAALPGQMILAAGSSGIALYIGDRQAKGMPIIPSRDNAAPAATPAPSTATPEVATA